MQLTTNFEDICDILILDAPSENLPGGNGKIFDWDILKDFKDVKISFLLALEYGIWGIDDNRAKMIGRDQVSEMMSF